MLRNSELFFLKNKTNSGFANRVSNSKVHIKVKRHNGYIDSYSIAKLIGDLNDVLFQHGNENLHLIIEFDKGGFKDKLVYILCECICSVLIEYAGACVNVKLDNKPSITTYGIMHTCMRSLENKNGFGDFINKFRFDILGPHYRRIIDNDYIRFEDYLCKIMQEICSFLCNLGVDAEAADELSEVISEVAGNAFDHAKAECLIDIDVAQDYVNNKTNQLCYGINVVVINFGENLLGDDISKKIQNQDLIDKRLEKVITAYNQQKQHFNDHYGCEDFFNIMAFQHGISGRNELTSTGGTGLTCLINSICEKSEANSCYVMSGDKILVFEEGYLTYNNDKWIGFNKDNDISVPPDYKLIHRSNAYLSGVAYNLNFVINR